MYNCRILYQFNNIKTNLLLYFLREVQCVQLLISYFKSVPSSLSNIDLTFDNNENHQFFINAVDGLKKLTKRQNKNSNKQTKYKSFLVKFIKRFAIPFWQNQIDWDKKCPIYIRQRKLDDTHNLYHINQQIEPNLIDFKNKCTTKRKSFSNAYYIILRKNYFQILRSFFSRETFNNYGPFK